MTQEISKLDDTDFKKMVNNLLKIMRANHPEHVVFEAKEFSAKEIIESAILIAAQHGECECEKCNHIYLSHAALVMHYLNNISEIMKIKKGEREDALLKFSSECLYLGIKGVAFAIERIEENNMIVRKKDVVNVPKNSDSQNLIN